jgi:hypothetical protein
MVSTITIILCSVKDLTRYTALFAEPGDFMMDFSNIIDPSMYVFGGSDHLVILTARDRLLDGVFQGISDHSSHLALFA